MCLNKLKFCHNCKSVPVLASKCTGCKRLRGKTTAPPVGQDSFKTNLAGTDQVGLAPCPLAFALMLSVVTQGPWRDLQLISSHTLNLFLFFKMLIFFLPIPTFYTYFSDAKLNFKFFTRHMFLQKSFYDDLMLKKTFLIIITNIKHCCFIFLWKLNRKIVLIFEWQYMFF